jgi:hypothetical protein
MNVSIHDRACFFVLPDDRGWRRRIVNQRQGLPIIFVKEFPACRMVYRESERQDLESGFNRAVVRFKIDASPRFRPAPAGVRICKLNQNIMTDLLGSSGTSGGACADRTDDWRANVLQGDKVVLFSSCRWATGGFQ